MAVIAFNKQIKILLMLSRMPMTLDDVARALYPMLFVRKCLARKAVHRSKEILNQMVTDGSVKLGHGFYHCAHYSITDRGLSAIGRDFNG